MKKIIAFIMTLAMVLGLSSVGVWATDATWQIEKPMPTARSGAASVVLNDKIYVMGGTTRHGYTDYATNILEIYDPTTNTWTTGTPMLKKIHRFSSVTVNNKIYVFGGLDSTETDGRSSKVQIYDLNTNTWSMGASMSTPRVDSVSVAVNNKIYVLGGSNNERLNRLDIYDPLTDSWTTGASMPTTRNSTAASSIGTNIYVYGGSSRSNFQDNVEVYNTETNTWTTKGALSTSRQHMASTVVGSKIYAIGGTSSSDITKTLEIYDTETDSWSTGASISEARIFSTAPFIGNKIYIVGGYNGSEVLSSMESLQVGPTVTTPEAPTSLTATGGNSKVDLSWGTVSGATSYTVKRSTTAGGPYTDIVTGVTGTTYTDTDVTNGTTYYYVVTAVNSAGSSTNSNEASATPKAGSSGGETGSEALLVITMTNGLEKEYELSATEINAFISWYDGKAAGSGAGYYRINKTFNLGPFLNRTDYLAFDKIQNFEVMQYQ